MTANESYRKLLCSVLEQSPGPSPRGLPTREILGLVTEVDMNYPIVTIPSRELDYQFMAAEAAWVLSGDRALSHPSLKKNLLKYSDDGRTMRGAYGPPFLQQVEYVFRTLRETDTRQAVMTLWERSPRESKDIPCTIALQWLIRDGKVNCNVFMRSSDAWLGWPYDVFTFTMMTLFVRSHLGLYSLGTLQPLGTLRIFAGSQHLYEERGQKAYVVAWNDSRGDGNNLAINTHSFNSPDDLICALIAARNAQGDHLQHLLVNLCH